MEQEREKIPWHPRQEPRIQGPLTPANVRRVFTGCVDFEERQVLLGGDRAKPVTLFTIGGMVRNERINDYVLKPVAQSEAIRGADYRAAFQLMVTGTVYNRSAQVRETMDQVVFDLIEGCAVFAFPGRPEMLSFSVSTEEKRSVSEPENEPPLKSARDSFVESIRTNTSLVRRRLRAPGLKIAEQIVGRQSLTPVDILYIEGLTDPELVKKTRARIEHIDVDELLATGNLEEYIIDELDTPFPLMAYTERPDRFCIGLTEGRVGILIDGIPLGYLLPGTVGQFFQTGEDRTRNWMAATCISLLRYLCMLASVLLPAVYVAAVNFHPEMIPVRLARSIAMAKVDVPFSTVFEVLILLVAFEIVQEAGLRLPSAIGQTVSILGGLVVGTAAVEAKIVSPAVLIVVAVAGIAGYTVPSQEFSGALRIWRFGLVVAASLAGLTGVVLASVTLVHHLARLESFGVPYLTPFAGPAPYARKSNGVIRWPLPWVKFRERALRTQNRRKQR